MAAPESQLFHQKVSAPNITSEVTTDLTERRFIFVVSQLTVAKSPRSQLCLKVMSWMQVHDPTIGDVTENCRTAGTVDPGQGVNQLGTVELTDPTLTH
uniref:Uncharacterized protein n=1 Tax=Timema cristinae TaxID=61476 RepID=A0A7R9CE05_TIMCR|nr:unnamed protein product [Timema cristinae]